MPQIIVYDDDVINAVQPDDGPMAAIGVDVNLNQYTSGPAGVSCSDVTELPLWTLSDSGIKGLFNDAGASIGSSGGEKVLISPDGTKVLFFVWAQDFDHFPVWPYLYMGIADINATGAVSDPVLTNYIRFRVPDVTVYNAVGVWEMGVGGSLVVSTYDFALADLQIWICPSIAQLEAGTFKGSHIGVGGETLLSDQGPTYCIQWTHASAEWMGYGSSIVQNGDVGENPTGFYLAPNMWFVLPKSWMSDGGSGLAANYAATYPDGAAFTLDIGAESYADHVWPPGEVVDDPEITADAVYASDLFVPPLPFPDEDTRIYDGGANAGFHASYTGRPVFAYGQDGAPVILFAIIDGNPTYDDDVGMGERIYYAKVRGYRWSGAAWQLFDTAAGIVLRQGDLGFSGYTFNSPESQSAFMVGGDIYLQIAMWADMGGAENARSVLTRFGRFIESETRTTQASGRHRYVSRT